MHMLTVVSCVLQHSGIYCTDVSVM